MVYVQIIKNLDLHFLADFEIFVSSMNPGLSWPYLPILRLKN
jgi:hypothetical protein